MGKKLFLAFCAALLALGLYAPAACGWTISGVVVDADGAVVEGARVVLLGIDGCPHGQGDFQAETNTDAEGRFGFHDIATGCYDIHAMADGLGAVQHRLGLVQRDVNHLQLQLPGRQGEDEREEWVVGGVVVNAQGHPIGGAEVTLLGLRGCPHGAEGFRSVTHTDADGRFTFHNVPTGCYEILVAADGYRGATVRLGLVDHDRGDIRIQLQAAHRGRAPARHFAIR